MSPVKTFLVLVTPSALAALGAVALADDRHMDSYWTVPSSAFSVLQDNAILVTVPPDAGSRSQFNWPAIEKCAVEPGRMEAQWRLYCRSWLDAREEGRIGR